MTDPADVRALARAVIERAAKDAQGHTSLYQGRPHQEAVAEARAWIVAGAAGFQLWAGLAEVDAGWLRRALIQRVAGRTGRLPEAEEPQRSFPPGAPTKARRNSEGADCQNGPMEDQTHG